MGQNLQFDPVKRDYIFQNGSPLPGTILEACYYALAIPENNWLYGIQNQGSLLYTLEGVKRTNDIEKTYASYARTAITLQIVETNQATSVGIKNLQSIRTGTLNQIEVIPYTQPVSNQISFVSV